MNTQKITVAIKATVPVRNDLCQICEYSNISLKDESGKCSLFKVRLEKIRETMIYLKCPACLDACANGFKRALDELSEGIK